MALSIVAGTTTQKNDNASANPLSVTLRQTPTVGNVLVVGLVTGNSSQANWTITDNKGNTYTRVDSINDARVALFYAPVTIASSNFIVSLNNGNNQTYKSIIVYEVTGIITGENLVTDQVVYNTGTSDAATGAASTGSITNTDANAILFSVISDPTAANNPATVTPGSGWSIDDTNAAIHDGVDYEVGGMDYKVVSSIASQSQTWILNTSDTFNALIASFRQVVPGVPARTLLGVGV